MNNHRYDFSRRHPRKNYVTEIVFAFKERIYNGTMKNISLGGAYIETAGIDRLSVGDVIVISIPFTKGHANIRQKARIGWKNEVGFAVEFL